MTRILRTTVAACAMLLVAQVGSSVSATAAPAAAPSARSVVDAVPTQTAPGPLGVAATRARQQGYLVPDQARYDAEKLAALAAAPGNAGPAASAPAAPTVTRNWEGIRNSQVAPSDSTGAIGTTRYLELINANFAIYDRVSNTPLSSGTLNQLVGTAAANSVFDPQVIWDPDTDRFFYATDLVVSATQNFLAFGFSKTDSPTTAGDFCQYTIAFGSDFPDYPKLGDTADFLLIGTNNFAGNTFSGGFAQWITKPGAGTTCPAAASLTTGSVGPLRDANGALTETPVPANQTDASSTGYLVSRANSDAGGSDTYVTLFTVSRLADGTASIPTTGAAVKVAAYSTPAAAPQPGVTQRLDTLDARLTQAVSAIDPARGAVGLWTQHTVTGGAGSQVRWYEINPAAATVFQKGSLTDAALWVFNGAVAPDRAVRGASAQFGSNLVAQVATTSGTSAPAIRAVTKRGTARVSSPVTIVASTAAYVGFDCARANSVCRWGDYAGATPDPVAATGATAGQVWISGQYATGGQGTLRSNWTTRNAAIRA